MRLSRSLGFSMAAFAFVALCCLAVTSIGTRAQPSPPYVPSVKIGTAAFIAPSSNGGQYPVNADAHYGTSTTSTDGLSHITGHATPVPVEIATLAAALKNDPDLIYQYVHNNIANEWTFGLSKGALGAMIDKSGTAFDQAWLMVLLLRQAGFTANIQIGYFSPTTTQFLNWTNITEAGAACQMLSSGGIPGSVNGQSLWDCSYAAHTAITSITLMHAWVIANIPGSSCAAACFFDPSLKTYSWRPGFARAATGIVAGDVYNTAISGMQSGTSSGLPYVSTLNQTGLNGKLSTYAANYLAYLKPPNNLQGAQIEDVFGGGVIQPDYSSVRQGTPAGYAPATNFPNPLAGVPDQFRSTLEVSAAEFNNHTGQNQSLFDETFFADEIYGRRLSVSTNFNDTQIQQVSDYSNYIVTLKLDDQQLASSTMTGVLWTEHFPATLSMTAIHPYAASADGSDTTNGDYMKAVIQKNVTLITPLSIVHAWGGVGPGLLAKWQGERAYDGSAPYRVADYGGCETCVPDYTSTLGDFQREKAQASYLAQYTRAARLHAGLANGIVQLHHVLGVIYADDAVDDTGLQTEPQPPDYFVADTYARFDIDSGLSFTNRTSDPVARRAAVQSIAATAAAIEGSMMMQLADVVDTSSTATRFEWANAPPCPDVNNPTTCEDPASAGGPAAQPRKIFGFAPSTAVPSGWVLWEKQVTPPAPGSTEDGNPQFYGTNFQSVLTADIALYANAGFQVTVPQESFLGPGQRGGYVKATSKGANPTYAAFFTKQRGGALIATKYDSNYNPTDIAQDVVGLIGGSPSGSGATPVPAKGGGGGAQPNGGATYNPNDAADVLKSKFVDRSNLFGVDLKTGTMSETAPASIETGNGGFPYALSGSFDWKAGPPPSDPATGPIPQGQPGSGWNLNWLSSLATSGSGMEAMGMSDIRGAAAAVAAFVAEEDIYTSTDPLISTTGSNKPYAQRDTAVALTQAWFEHQMSGNVATVSVGKSARQFVRTPDGNWFEPGPGYATMAETGSRVLSQAECPSPQAGQAHYALSRGWNYNPVSWAVTNSHGDVESFGFWVNHYANPVGATICARRSGFRLNSWTFPYGVTVSVNYPATTDYDSHMINAPSGPFPSASAATGVSSNLGTSGRSLAFTLDANGNVTAVKDGTRTLSLSLLQSSATDFTTDPAGARTTFGYLAAQPANDDPGAGPLTRPVPYRQLTQVFTADNPTHANIQYDYDALGEVSAVHDAYAVLHPTSRGPYVFHIGDGTRGERDDPLGGAYSVTFDTYGHPARYIDEIGRETDAIIDSRSRPMQYTYPEGDEEVFGYDDHDNMVSYEKIGTTASCTPTCPTLTATAVYDQTWNKPTSVTNFRGKTTTLTYFNSGNGTSLLHSVSRPADAHLSVPVYNFSYNSYGKVTEADVPFVGNGVTTVQWIATTSTYDPANENLLTSTLDPGSGHVAAVTAYGYDAYGNVTSTTDPRGAVTISSYDPDRRKLEDDHHVGNSSAPLNAVSKTQYDIIGRDIEDDQAKCFDNATTCPNSGSTVVTWVATKKTTYTATSKVKTVTDADDSVTTSDYDGDDRVVTVTDPVGRQAHYVFDAAGQKLKEIRAWSTGTGCSASGTLQECYATFTYGLDGETASEMDANGALAAPTYKTSYAYDGFLRLSTTTFPDGSTEVIPLAGGYDENGNILIHTNRAGQSETFTYDNLDRVLTKVMPATAVNPIVTTSYDYYLNAAPYTESDTLANALTYGYDTAGRLTSTATAIPGAVNGGVAQTANYVLDANGNRTVLAWPDLTCAAYTFDSLNRMTVVNDGTYSTTTKVCTPNTPALVTYTYDAMSRRMNLAYPAAAMAYTYSDGGDLLTLNHSHSGTGTAPNYTLTFTPAHQLWTEASSESTYVWQPAPVAASDSYTAANKLNQYPSWTPNGSALQSFTYDLNGNMTGGTINGAAWTYAYDPENRLITANRTSGGTVAASYAYDTKGRRTRKSGTGVTETFFLSDGTDEIAEYNGSGTETTRYVPGPAIDEPVTSVTVSTNVHRYFQTDHHGSVIAMVSQGGNELEGPYTYDTYGNCFSGGSTCGSSGTPYRYVGMRYDPETGLYYDRARMYSSALGRFMQVDPVGYTADLNLYTYVGNDPNDRTDPSGLEGLALSIDEFYGNTNSGNISNAGVAISYHKGVIQYGAYTTTSGKAVGVGGGLFAGASYLPKDLNAMSGKSITVVGAVGDYSGSVSTSINSGPGTSSKVGPTNSITLAHSKAFKTGVGGGGGVVVGETDTQLHGVVSINVGAAVDEAMNVLGNIEQAAQKVGDAIAKAKRMGPVLKPQMDCGSTLCGKK